MITNPLLPLDDLVVIELGDSIAAAHAGKLMADIGARVIRIDDTSGGALYRHPPLVGADERGLPVSAAWLHLNRLKESLTLDLEHSTAGEVLADLFARADVVIDGRGLGWLTNLGFPYTILQEKFPRLLIATITPFGLTGPYRDWPASDLMVTGLGGLLNMVGFPDREPLSLGGYQTQYAAGLSAFTGLMAALMHRDRGGEGQLVDVSMLESVSFIEWKSGAYFEADGRVRYRSGTSSQWMILEARDGYVALVYQDANYPGVVAMTGIEELQDERFATRKGRVARADELQALMGPWAKERTKAEIYHAGQAQGVPLGFVATVQDLLDSPQYEARGFWQTIEHPATGPVQYPGTGYLLDGIDLPQGRAPVPGEHTGAILRDLLGWSDEQVQRYRLEQVI